MPKSKDARKVNGGKCYFSTFIDEETITCSPDGGFDFCGFPIKLCDKLDFCDKIKEANSGFQKLLAERKNKKKIKVELKNKE